MRKRTHLDRELDGMRIKTMAEIQQMTGAVPSGGRCEDCGCVPLDNSTLCTGCTKDRALRDARAELAALKAAARAVIDCTYPASPNSMDSWELRATVSRAPVDALRALVEPKDGE